MFTVAGSQRLGILFAALCIFCFSAHSQDEFEVFNVAPIGDGSEIVCAEDSIGIFIAEFFEGEFFEVRVRRVRKVLRRRLRRLQRQRRRLIFRGASESRINALQLRINELVDARRDVDDCLNGLLFDGSGGDSGGGDSGGGDSGGGDSGGGDALSSPCSIIGATGSRSQAFLGYDAPVAHIINGTECPVGDSPIVRLDLLDSSGFAFSSCTGTVVTNRAVVSAAHCFPGDVSGVNVVTGLGTFSATSFTNQPSYDDRNFREDNDVAVVMVGQDIPTRKVRVLQTDNLMGGESVIIGGYGRDERGNFDQLKAGTMTVNSVSGGSISALFEGSGSNTCVGDSGGPLLVERSGEWVLAGVTSNGSNPQCLAFDDSRFGNVAEGSNLSFILGQIPDLPS